MSWSRRRNQELAQRGRDRAAATWNHADCPPGEERHRSYWSPLAGDYRVQYHYRHPDGTLFTCVAPRLADAQAQRNTWLVEKAYMAACARAKFGLAEMVKAAESDAAALVDADLYRDMDTGGYDR